MKTYIVSYILSVREIQNAMNLRATAFIVFTSIARETTQKASEGLLNSIFGVHNMFSVEIYLFPNKLNLKVREDSTWRNRLM